MANRIKIRRGSGNPGSNLLPYELGWDTTNKALYINDGGTSKIAALPLTGGTLSGLLTTLGSLYADSYSGAINMNNSNIFGLNSIYTADVSDNASEGIHFYRDTTHVDTLWMNGGDLLFVPNRALGTGTTKANSYIVLHSNNYTTYTVTKTGTGASGSWGISITGTAAKASGLVDGSSTMTSAYNKAGLGYDNYSWLAGWNGYELRAVDKTQFARASHTHSYLPLSGGTITGTLTVGSSSAASSSSHALWTTGITVHDTRYDAISVTSLSKAVNFFFSNNTMPDSNWWAGMHVAGWTGDYNAWELVGPAHASDLRTKNLYIRVGRTSTGWSSWRALVTSSDTTSRRIFVAAAGTTTPPSGAVNGDIVLVKAS